MADTTSPLGAEHLVAVESGGELGIALVAERIGGELEDASPGLVGEGDEIEHREREIRPLRFPHQEDAVGGAIDGERRPALDLGAIGTGHQEALAHAVAHDVERQDRVVAASAAGASANSDR